MSRFTIRDLLWLMIVAAVCASWFAHVRAIRLAELRRSEEMLRQAQIALEDTRSKWAELEKQGVKLPKLPK